MGPAPLASAAAQGHLFHAGHSITCNTAIHRAAHECWLPVTLRESVSVLSRRRPQIKQENANSDVFYDDVNLPSRTLQPEYRTTLLPNTSSLDS